MSYKTQSLLVFIITFLNVTDFTQQQTPSKPVITSVKQISDRSVSIGWTVSGTLVLKRYLIESIQDQHQWNFERPAQMMLVNYNVNSNNEMKVNAKSYMDCRNKCINDAKCLFSVSSYSTTSASIDCILKYQVGATEMIQSEDTECASLQTYSSDNVTIDELHHGHVHQFRVKVLSDSIWSEFSDWSQPIDMRINLVLSVERVSYKSLLLKWKQVNNLQGVDYIISKYKVILERDGAKYKYSLNDSALFEKVTFKPNYDTLVYDNNEGSLNESSCYQRCISNDYCVFAVHFTKSYQNANITANDCFKKISFEPLNAGLKRVGSTAYRLKNNANQFEFYPPALNFNYSLSIEYALPDGEVALSENVFYNLYDIKPTLHIRVEYESLEFVIEWFTEDYLEISKIQLFHSNTSNDEFTLYYIERSIEYGNAIGDPLYVDFNSCYKKCFETRQCYSITWTNNTNSTCILKDNGTNTRTCPLNSTCVTMLGNSTVIRIKDKFVNTDYCYKIQFRTADGYTGALSNPYCTRFDFNISLEHLNYTTIEDDSYRLLCRYPNASDSLIQVTWFKDGRLVNLAELNAETINEINMGQILKIDELNYGIVNGIYYCNVKVKNEQEFQSNLFNVTLQYIGDLKFNDGEPVIGINENDSANITCSAEGIPVRNISLLFNNTEISDELLIEYENDRFKFKTIQIINATKAENNGQFVCIDYENGISVTVDVVVGTKPSKPTLISASTTKVSSEIEWNVDDNGGLSISKLIAEWSIDFTFGIDGSYTVINPSLNKTLLNIRLPEKSLVRIMVSNSLGNSSISNQVNIVCSVDDCSEEASSSTTSHLLSSSIEPLFSSLSSQSPLDNSTTKRPSSNIPLIAGISVGVGLIVIIVVVIIIFVFCRRQNKKPDDMNNIEMENKQQGSQYEDPKRMEQQYDSLNGQKTNKQNNDSNPENNYEQSQIKQINDYISMSKTESVYETSNLKNGKQYASLNGNPATQTNKSIPSSSSQFTKKVSETEANLKQESVNDYEKSQELQRNYDSMEKPESVYEKSNEIQSKHYTYLRTNVSQSNQGKPNPLYGKKKSKATDVNVKQEDVEFQTRSTNANCQSDPTSEKGLYELSNDLNIDNEHESFENDESII